MSVNETVGPVGTTESMMVPLRESSIFEISATDRAAPLLRVTGTVAVRVTVDI